MNVCAVVLLLALAVTAVSASTFIKDEEFATAEGEYDTVSCCSCRNNIIPFFVSPALFQRTQRDHGASNP